MFTWLRAQPEGPGRDGFAEQSLRKFATRCLKKKCNTPQRLMRQKAE